MMQPKELQRQRNCEQWLKEKLTVVNTRNFILKKMVSLLAMALMAPVVLTLASNDWQTRFNVLASISATPPPANRTPAGIFDYTGCLMCTQMFEQCPPDFYAYNVQL